MNLEKTIVGFFSLVLGALTGYLLLTFVCNPFNKQKVQKQYAKKYKYKIEFWGSQKRNINELYCDSFNYQNKYCVEIWVDNRKSIIHSRTYIGVRENE